MNASKKQINEWAERLSPKQSRILITRLVSRMMEIEEVRFWSDNDNLAPYWEGDGEPIVPGQKTFSCK